MQVKQNFRAIESALGMQPAKRTLADAIALLQTLPDDFTADGRDLSPPRERESF